MKTSILIPIVSGLILASIVGGLYGANVVKNLQGQQKQEDWVDLRESTLSSMKEKQPEHLPVKNLLLKNNIDYDPDTFAIAGGITLYGGDPGCGAVIDKESEIHWFHVDSISDPTNMTLYSENPRPCKINHDSCFCNAQMEFTAITLDELSYLTTEQEKQVGKRVKKYFETIPHEISLNKFVVGKYNFDMGENYTGICGALITDYTDFSPDDKPSNGVSIHGYFSGYMDGPRLWDFSTSVDNENLCAISDDAKIFEFQKSEE